MKITEVKRRRRSLYLLVLDGQEGPVVDVRTFDESPYGVDSVLTEKELEALLACSQYNRARDRALYLLGLRDYACRELEQKLAQEAPPEVAAAVVERLRDVGLLDDERYASRLADSLSRTKRYPRRRVEQELRRRGVEAELARGAADELECEDFQQALALLQKRYYNKMQDEESRRKTMAALMRRGFSYTAVRQAAQAFDEAADTQYEEIETWL
ncbi:MAG: regulatory protein RecX [Clostridia bacterium]|nr:regulatory protein RecX [Clostridia bacterium]